MENSPESNESATDNSVIEMKSRFSRKIISLSGNSQRSNSIQGPGLKVSFDNESGEEVEDSSTVSDDVFEKQLDLIDEEKIDDSPSLVKSDSLKAKQEDLVSEIFRSEIGTRTANQIKLAKEFLSACFDLSVNYPSINIEKIAQVVYLQAVENANTVIIQAGSPVSFWFMVYSGKFSSSYQGQDMELQQGEGLPLKLKDVPQHHSFTISTMEPNCEYLGVDKEKFVAIMRETTVEEVEVDGKVVMVKCQSTVNDRTITSVLSANLDMSYEIIKTDREFADVFLSNLPYVIKGSRKQFYKYVSECFDIKEIRLHISGLLVTWFQQNYRILLEEEEFQEFWSEFQEKIYANSEIPLVRLLVDTIRSYSPLIHLKLSRHPDTPIGFQIKTKSDSKIVHLVDPDSEAYEAGIRMGDELIFLDGICVKIPTSSILMSYLENLYSFTLIVRRCPLYQKVLQATSTNITGKNSLVKGNKKPENTRNEDADHKLKNAALDSIKKTFCKVPKYWKSKLKSSSENSPLDDPTLSPNSPFKRMTNSPIYDMHKEIKNTGYVRIYCEEMGSYSKYFPLHQHTCCKVLMDMAVSEFRVENQDQSYSLYEIGASDDKFITSSRVNESTLNILYRLPYNFRYYLKPIGKGIKNTIETDLLKDSAISFIDLNVTILARIITFQDFCHFASITPYQYHYFTKGEKFFHLCTDYIYFKEKNEVFSNFIISIILRDTTYTGRVKIIRYFINLAEACVKIGGFNTAFIIYVSLISPDIDRLVNTMERIGAKNKAKLEELGELMSLSSEMKNYRQKMTEIRNNGRHVVPIVSTLANKIIVLTDGMDKKSELIDYRIFRMITQRLTNIIYYWRSLEVDAPLLTILKNLKFPHALTLHILQETKFFELASESGEGGQGENSQDNSAVSGNSTITNFMSSLIKNQEKKYFEDITMMKRCLHFLENSLTPILFTDMEEREKVSLNLETIPSAAGLKDQMPSIMIDGKPSAEEAISESNKEAATSQLTKRRPTSRSASIRKSIQRPVSMALGTLMLRGLKSQRKPASDNLLMIDQLNAIEEKLDDEPKELELKITKSTGAEGIDEDKDEQKQKDTEANENCVSP